MRGGALPPALLCAALGLLLAYAPRKAIIPAITALVVAATAILLIRIPARFEEIAFLGCWVSVMVIAASIHLPNGPGLVWSLVLSVIAGLWAGAVVSIAGKPLDLAIGLPCVLIVGLAIWVRRTPVGLAVKIAASWLGAVAILAAAIPLTPTPGYEPDHRE